MSAGLIRVNNPQSVSVVVTITDQYAATPTVYADDAGTSQDNPATITDTQEFHVSQPGDYMVAMTINGLDAGGGSVHIDGSVAEFEPGVDQTKIAGSLGGGGGSEQSVPLADTALTIDTTTYDNTVKRSGKITTVIAPASDDGGDTVAFAFAVEGDAFPRALFLTDPTDGVFYLSDGTYDPYQRGALVFLRPTDGALKIQAAGSTSHLVIGDGADLATFSGAVTANRLTPLVVFDASGLPTSDPTVAGEVWNNLGILTVSTG